MKPHLHRGSTHQWLDDSCGCAMGALFTGVGLFASATYYGWQYWRGLALSTTVFRVFLATFLAASAGKVIGILRYRMGRRPSASPLLPHPLDPLPKGE